MLLAMTLLVVGIGLAYLVLFHLLRLRVHRLDEVGRREPWRGPSVFAQVNLLTATNYDAVGRRKLIRLKVAMLGVWLVFMAGLLLVFGQWAW